MTIQTQLAIDLEPTAPLQSWPQAAQKPQVCPVRHLCLLATMRSDYRCGFEQAGTVAACPKRRRLGT